MLPAWLSQVSLQEGGVLYTWGGMSGGTLPSGTAASAPVKADSNKGCLGLGDSAGRDRPTRWAAVLCGALLCRAVPSWHRVGGASLGASGPALWRSAAPSCDMNDAHAWGCAGSHRQLRQGQQRALGRRCHSTD